MAPRPPRDAAAELDIGEALARAHGHWNAGQAEQAELHCQRVLAVWPGQPDALHLLGLMAHAYGNPDLAVEHLRQACRSPRAPGAYFSNLAELCRRQGLLEEAERAGRRAVTLAPDQVAGWNNLGIVLQESGKLEESLACLERVAAAEPDSPTAHNNLGNTCRRLGRPDEAERHYDRALSLDPDYAEAHSNRANLLSDRGRFDEAAAAARRAIEIAPQFADAYVNLASVELARGRPGDSLRWLEALLAFAPGHARGLALLALVLRRFGRLDEALRAARRAVAAAAGSAEAQDALGLVLQASGRFEEALEAFDRAAALPGFATESVLVHRAALLVETGQQEAARDAFERTLETFPRAAAAHAGLADLLPCRPGDPRLERMEALLRDGAGLSEADRTVLRFTLGRALLDLGESDRAFRHLEAGNRAVRATTTYDAAATGRWIESIAEVFSAERLARPAGAGASSELPVFVVGMPRSGTSLVEQILASHSQVEGAGELSVLQRLVDGLGDYPAAAGRLTEEALGRLGRAYLAEVEPLAAGARRLVDKMPANVLHVGLIRLILPGARIVHCRRDPVETCLSCYAQLFEGEQAFAYDLAELGRFHRDYQALTAHWRGLLPPERFLELDYEALVDDLEGQARRLLAFLDLPWDPACLRFHETRRPVRTASANQVRRPLYASSTRRWPAHARHLGPLLEALGVGEPGEEGEGA